VHIGINLLFILASWKWGNWSRWRHYHATMLYVAICDLLYLFLTANHQLWSYVPEPFLKHYALTEALYALVMLPATVLIFLSRLPAKPLKQAGHCLLWVGILFTIECVLLSTGRFRHLNGWSLYWSLGFDLVMFPMLILHYKKPLLAYLVSAAIVVYLLWQFEIPSGLPIEARPVSR